MSKIGDCVEMADARLRIRERFEHENIAAATTRHRVATAVTDENVVLRAAYKRVGTSTTNEDEGIVRGEVSINRQIGSGQIVQGRAIDSQNPIVFEMGVERHGDGILIVGVCVLICERN